MTVYIVFWEIDGIWKLYKASQRILIGSLLNPACILNDLKVKPFVYFVVIIQMM